MLESVEPLIREIRGERVVLDHDLARIYGVPTKRLNEQIRRNPDRFPPDFVFRLTEEEAESLTRTPRWKKSRFEQRAVGMGMDA